MEDKEFQELFRRIVDRYELAPDAAEALLHRILAVLSNRAPEEDGS